MAPRIIHYLNQFFGGIGGEAAADAPATVREGAVGPGRALQAILGDRAQIAATVICGDNWAQAHAAEAAELAVKLAGEKNAELLFAGPAFQSGRYGIACASITDEARRRGLRSIAAMHPENPGLAFSSPAVPIVRAGETAADMREALALAAEVLLAPEGVERLEARVLREVRVNRFEEKIGAARAVDMLLRKMTRQPFETELPRPRFEPVTPAAPIDPARAKIALVSTGGVVPRGNPGKLEASTATKWLHFSIAGKKDLAPDEFECIHAGFDTSFANVDPDRVVPLDVCRALESEGKIRALHDELFVTVGNLTPVKSAERFAREMIEYFRRAEIQAAILTAT